MTTPSQLIDVLSQRHNILRSLRDDPKERHVLVDHLADSKSTVYKGVSQLKEAGLIKHTSAGMEPTLFGVVALDRYNALAETAELGGLLASLPPGTIDPSALIGAEAITPETTAVTRHLAQIESMLRNADSIRGLSPAIDPDYVSILHQRIINDELTAEFVLTEEIVADLRRDYPEVAGEIISSDRVALFGTANQLPFTLLIVAAGGESEVAIELGDEGLPTGVIWNDTSESHRWAETIYERYKQTAERVAA